MKVSSPIVAALIVAAGAAAACGDGNSSGTAGSDAGTPDGGVTLRLAKNHRAAATACSAVRPPGILIPQEDGGTPASENWCYRDSDCTAGKDGRCAVSHGGAYSRKCNYSTCTQDSDCGSGKACLCNDEYGHSCQPYGCRIDADCPDHLGCSPSGVGYQCHTTKDECIDDADCGGCSYCGYDQASSRWQCRPSCVP